MHLRFGVSSAVVDAFPSKTNIDFAAHDTKKERLLLVNQIVDASASIRGLFCGRQSTGPSQAERAMLLPPQPKLERVAFWGEERDRERQMAEVQPVERPPAAALGLGLGLGLGL